MSSTASTAVATHHDVDHDVDYDIDGPSLERKMSQAYEEGHDADIPSSAGYILSQDADLKRVQSIHHQRSGSTAAQETTDRDVEKAEMLDRIRTNKNNDDDPNIVWWDGENDPENPYNWTTMRKIVNCGAVSFQTFLAPLASCKSNANESYFIYHSHQAAFVLTPSRSYIRSWCASGPGRVPLELTLDCHLCRLRLPAWLCSGSYSYRSLVRDLRTCPCLSCLQRRFRGLLCRLRPRAYPRRSHRLPFLRRFIRRRARHQRRRHRRRHDPPEAARRRPGRLQHRSLTGTHHRTYRRWLPYDCQGLAVEFLAPRHHQRCPHRCHVLYLEGELRARDPAEEGSPTTQGDGK